LIRAPLSTTSVLDETTEVVARAGAGWAAVVAATSLPYRFLQVFFLERVMELGENATHFGRALTQIATLVVIAFLVSRWGRAIWARACRLAEEQESAPGREVWSVPPVALLSYLFTASLAELLYYSTAITIIGPLLAAAISGLAIGTCELNTKPGVTPPLRLIARHARASKQLFAFLFVFVVAVMIAFINITVAFAAGEWLAHAFAGLNLARWDLLLSFRNKHFVRLAMAGAIVAVEPFWIAAHVVLVRRAGVAETGEDLRIWFRRLQEKWAR